MAGYGDLGSVLTVADCLRMEPLAGAVLEAGAAGINRPVRWVHVVDIPEIEECLVGGELILTSGISLGHDQSLQNRIVPIMHELELAGLVIAIGPYIERVPATILRAADEYAIPVISIPWSINFRDITETLMAAILHQQYALLARSERIHRSLTELVLQGGNLSDLARRLAQLLNRSVVIVDPVFQHLASELTSHASAFARRLAAGGRPPEEARDLMLQHTRYTDGWPAPRASIGRSVDPPGILAPILVDHRIHGYLWLDSNEQASSAEHESDLMTVERAATVAALLIYKDDAVREAERRLDVDLLDALLDGGLLDEGLIERARRSSLLSEGPYGVAVLDIGTRDSLVAAKVAQIAASRIEALAHVRVRNRQLVIIAPCTTRARLRAIAEEVCSAFIDHGHEIPFGLSDIVRGVYEIGHAYREARDALEIGRVVDPDLKRYAIYELRTLQRFTATLAIHDGMLPESPVLAELDRHDREKGTNLVETLEAYLRSEGNTSAAARELGIHRHTLLYRLDRIRELTNLTFTPATRLDLRLTLLAWRMHERSRRSPAR